MSSDEGVPKLALRAEQAAEALSISPRLLATWTAAGRLPFVLRIGSVNLYPVDQIREWLALGGPDRETWQRLHVAKK